jgi:hypothetical protein
MRGLLLPTGHGSDVAKACALLLLAPPLYIYVRAQLIHLTLVLTERVGQPFESTFRLVSYANASVAPLLLLPYAGDFAFLVLGALVETIGIRWCHDLTLRQAFITEVLPASFVMLSILGVVLLGVLWWSQFGT